MPWTASSVMEERLRFVARLLDGESMTDVCREFGISRKTGYKIFDRYKEHGLAALTDRSRRPVRYANQLPLQVETLIVRLKGENQQQAKFDDFIGCYNTERPHEALAMKCPAELYAVSPRRYNGLPEFDYPFHDRDILVTACGRICLHRNISTVFAGQRLGIKEVDDGVWLVSFTHYDLGYFDLEQRTLQPLDNPFGPRLSPMS